MDAVLKSRTKQLSKGENKLIKWLEKKQKELDEEHDCDKNEYWDADEEDCECKDGYTENNEKECIKVKDCDENEHWDAEEGDCECNDGYSENKKKKCIKIEECDDNEHWDADEGACECDEGFTEDDDGECVEDHDCDENEYWDEDTEDCECVDGYTEEDGECVEDHDCDENEYWDEDTEDCECVDGYIEEDGECVKEHDCNINEEWNENLKNCVCIEGYEKNEIDICESVEDEEEELIDDCSVEYIQSLAFLLEVLVAETKLYETELIGYINKFNKEINDQSSDPCRNNMIAYCYYSATEIVARMAENVTDIHDLTVEIIMLQAMCPDLNQQMQGEGITIKSLISSIAGLGSYKDKLAQMESRLRENGCDEEEVKDDGEKVVPPEGDPGKRGDGGDYVEIPGDGDDNDGDGQQDEEVEGLSGYNVTLVLYDSGSAADDVFGLSVTGYGSLGQTPAGGLRSYGLNLLPGSYTAVVTVVLAPDDYGTYTLNVLYEGESIGSITGAPPQGSAASLIFTVPSE